jgi:enoyl-CoA hydratase/carnithine racemase
MLSDILKIIPDIEKTKAYWIEGAGGKAFCAGGDVKSIYLNKEIGPSFFRT